MTSTSTSNTGAAGGGEWAEPGMGKRWQDRFTYWSIRLLGKRPAYHISYLVTFWYVLFYPAIRRRAGFYLGRRFGEKRGGLRRFWDAYRLVRTFGVTLVDIMAFGIVGEKSLKAFSPDHEKFVPYYTDTSGFIMLQAHVGGWQVGLSTLGKIQKQVSLVMIPEARGQRVLDHFAVKVIDPREGLGAVVEMTQALCNGEVIGMMGDRAFGDEHNVVEVDFLGSKVRLPVTPYRLASATGVPILVVMAPKTKGCSYELRLIKVIEVEAGLGRKAGQYARYAQEFAEALEGFVEAYPWQFFNFYDLWNDAPLLPTER